MLSWGLQKGKGKREQSFVISDTREGYNPKRAPSCWRKVHVSLLARTFSFHARIADGVSISQFGHDRTAPESERRMKNGKAYTDIL